MPKFEHLEAETKEPIKMTKEERQNYFDRDVEDPELHKWMEEKGIEFDKGFIKVEVDGELMELCTDRDEFGLRKYE